MNNFVASASDINRTKSSHLDFDVKIYVGPKREQISAADIKDGLALTNTNASTILTNAYTPGDSSLSVGRTAQFSSSGAIWISNNLIVYGSKTDTTFGSLQWASPIVLSSGLTVTQWQQLENADKITINGTLDSATGSFTASLSGYKFDSRLISPDYSILIQLRVYPSYPPSPRIGAPLSVARTGAPNANYSSSTGSYWSPWFDFYIGYIKEDSISVDWKTNTWGCSLEGTSQYLKKAQADAHSFGRIDLALSKQTSASSTLNELSWERISSSNLNGEYYGSPTIASGNCVDGNRDTLWISDTSPFVSTGGTPIRQRNIEIIRAFMKAPLGEADYRYQWFELWNSSTIPNNLGQRRIFGTKNYAARGMSLSKLLDVNINKGGEVSLGDGESIIFCYDLECFKRLFPTTFGVKVVQWRDAYPDFWFDPNDDYLVMTLDSYFERDTGHFDQTGHYGGGIQWGTEKTFIVGSIDTTANSPRTKDAGLVMMPRPLYPGEAYDRDVTVDYDPTTASGTAGYRIVSVPRPGQFFFNSGNAQFLSVDLGTLETTLTAPINATDTIIPVATTASFNESGYILIDDEVISYGVGGKQSQSFETALAGRGRNVIGMSDATSHTAGTKVYQVDLVWGFSFNVADAAVRQELCNVSKIEWSRTQGKPVPKYGQIYYSIYSNPATPLSSSTWGRDWEPVCAINNSGNPQSSISYQLAAPTRMRQVLFYIEQMSDGKRAKLNEVKVWEATDDPMSFSVGEVVKHFLVSHFGLSDSELTLIKTGPTYGHLNTAKSKYWQALSSLAENTNMVFVVDQFNKIWFVQNPVIHYPAAQSNIVGSDTSLTPVVAFNWDADSIYKLDVKKYPTHNVSQVVLTARDEINERTHEARYPDTPDNLGDELTANIALFAGPNEAIWTARQKYKYANRGWGLQWTCGLVDWVRLGQRHVVTYNIDEAGVYLNGINVVVTGITWNIALGKNKSFVTTINAEEYTVN